MKKRIGYVLIVALVFLIGFRVGHYDITLQWQKYNPQLSVVNKEPPPSYQEVDFQQFWDTWDAMTRLYLDKSKLNPQKMVYGAISGMVRSVGDPYTVFLDPEQNKEFEQDINGTYEGVGLQIGYQKERLVVIAPLKDTPAEAAGIRAGDAILSIDGEESFNMTLFDAVAKIRGPLGTKVTLTLTRDGYESSFDVTLTRAQITVKTVDFTLREDGIAYLKVSRFGDQTAAEWDEAIKQIVAAESKGIILDLRNNPGGYLSGAVYLASEFLSAGTVVVEEEGSGEFLTFEVNHAASLPKTPLVVLINKG
ncbi:MAG TPA: S41 family peptidase, partial [Patescibacteria group bacterium]|nr:S41 family peptidase [Patescibacteria group bacterium]